MTTGTISTYPTAQLGGIAGLAVRIGQGLEAWGQRVGQPQTRAELEQLVAIELEARAAIGSRGDAHSGMYQLLR